MQDHLLLAGVDLNSSRSLLEHHIRRAPEHALAQPRECMA